MYLFLLATQTKAAHADADACMAVVEVEEETEEDTTVETEGDTTEDMATDSITPELNSKSLLEPSLGSKTKEGARVTRILSPVLTTWRTTSVLTPKSPL